MLTVCTSSTSEALIDKDLVKDLLGIAGSTDDDLLDTLINSASMTVETFVGRPLRAQVYQETVPAYGTRHLMLARTPIRAMFRLFDSTATGEATQYCSTDYRIEDADAGMLSRDAGFGWTAPVLFQFTEQRQVGQETRPYLAEYAAGYQALETTSTEFGVTSTGVDLPGDIRLAVAETVKAWWLARRSDPAIASAKIGSLEVNLRSEMGTYGLPKTAIELLRPRRRLT